VMFSAAKPNFICSNFAPLHFNHEPNESGWPDARRAVIECGSFSTGVCYSDLTEL